MTVASILRQKGSRVISVSPDATIEQITKVLATERIGAVLVRDLDGVLIGILSERDIVRGLADRGAETLRLPAHALMSRGVATCTPEDSVAHVMEIMTERRFRHVPVIEHGRLVGMISIGDVVKERLGEQAEEVEGLRAFVAGAA